MCRRGHFSGDKLALHAAYTQTYTRSHTYTDSCINTASQIEQFTGCTHSDLTHSDLWLSLSSHSYTVFPIFRFLLLLSIFSVFPQLGKRLRHGGLVGFALWVCWGGGGCVVAWEQQGWSVGRSEETKMQGSVLAVAASRFFRGWCQLDDLILGGLADDVFTGKRG